MLSTAASSCPLAECCSSAGKWAPVTAGAGQWVQEGCCQHPRADKQLEQALGLSHNPSTISPLSSVCFSWHQPSPNFWGCSFPTRAVFLSWSRAALIHRSQPPPGEGSRLGEPHYQQVMKCCSPASATRNKLSSLPATAPNVALVPASTGCWAGAGGGVLGGC